MRFILNLLFPVRRDLSPSVFPCRIVIYPSFAPSPSLSESFLNCEDHKLAQYSRCSVASARWNGMITCLPLPVMPLQRGSIWCAFFTATVHCWLMFSLWPIRIPKPLTSKAGPQPHASWPVFKPRCRTLPLSVFHFILFVPAHSSSLPSASCKMGLPSNVSTSPPSLVSSANWRGCFHSHHPEQPGPPLGETICDRLNESHWSPPSKCSLSANFLPSNLSLASLFRRRLGKQCQMLCNQHPLLSPCQLVTVVEGD